MRIILFFTLALTPLFQALQKEPDPASQKQAEASLKETFKADYARKQPGDVRDLAGKLSEYSSTVAPQEGALRYVALRESRDLYARIGEWERSLQTVDHIGRAFEIEVIPMKMAVLTKVAATAQGTDIAMISNLYFSLACDGLAADRFEDAVKCLAMSENGARAAKDAALVASVASLKRDADILRTQYQRTRPPSAQSGELGRYLCLYKGDWERGLPELAQIKDEQLRALAEAEIAKPTSVQERLQVADGWWDWGWKEKDLLAKARAQTHACILYERINGVDEATKARIEERRKAHEISRLGDRLECVPGVPQRSRGIRILQGIADGKGIMGFHLGRPCAFGGTGEAGPCLYFELPNLWTGKDGFLEVTAEVLDLTATVSLGYNEKDATGKLAGKAASPNIVLGNTGAWKSYQWKIPAVACNDLMHGADFRLVSSSELYLHRLTVRKVAK